MATRYVQQRLMLRTRFAAWPLLAGRLPGYSGTISPDYSARARGGGPRRLLSPQVLGDVVLNGRHTHTDTRPHGLRAKEDYYSLCYCVSSWFRLPEQGMDEYELLSRASCVMLPRGGDWSPEGGAMHILTSAHVVHPFAFPRYYPPDQHAWLQFVGEQHVMTKLEVREQAEGKVIFETTLHDKVFRHASRDMCVLHPEDPEALMREICGIRGGSPTEHVLRLELDEAAGDKGAVVCVGHQIIQESGPLQEQLPTVVLGNVLGCTAEGQAFAATETPLQMGMCGGPVVNARGACVGVVEGIVPETGPEPLRFCAAIITAGQVRSFLADVEHELAQDFPPR